MLTSPAVTGQRRIVAPGTISCTRKRAAPPPLSAVECHAADLGPVDQDRHGGSKTMVGTSAPRAGACRSRAGACPTVVGSMTVVALPFSPPPPPTPLWRRRGKRDHCRPLSEPHFLGISAESTTVVCSACRRCRSFADSGRQWSVSDLLLAADSGRVCRIVVVVVEHADSGKAGNSKILPGRFGIFVREIFGAGVLGIFAAPKNNPRPKKYSWGRNI